MKNIALTLIHILTAPIWAIWIIPASIAWCFWWICEANTYQISENPEAQSLQTGTTVPINTKNLQNHS